MDTGLLGAATAGAAISVITFVITVLLAWSKLTERFDNRIQSMRRDMENVALCGRRELKALEAELHTYKIDATDKYASTKHLEDVEGRLIRAIQDLSKEIHRLVDRLDGQFGAGK